MFFKVRIYGMENVPEDGALLFLSNHQSVLDPLFCGCVVRRPLYFLARDSLFKIFIFGKLIASINAMPVKRGTADLGAIRGVITKLKQGYGVCLYPEATRTRDGKIATLKPGFGLICRRGNASVVPMVIDGAFECWPRHKKIFSPGTIAVSFGKVIPIEQIKEMGDKAFAEMLTNTLRKIQNQCREKQGKEPYQY